MSKQTALQKAIEQLKEHKSNSYTTLYRLGCQNAIDTLTELLPYEREVIEDAYNQGADDLGSTEFGGTPGYRNKSDYFTKTFTAQP